MKKESIKIGVIGCGKISSRYFENMKKFEILDCFACADIISKAADAKAKEFNIPKVYSVKELLNDKDIKIVVNLTIPNAHAEVALASLHAGKSVYNEKPLAITREDGKKILELAKSKGLLVGCAPDTFLGPAHQTCRKIIDDGIIGEVVAGTAFMLSCGSYRPGPAFLYQPGGGPMFDMGPYYLTAFVNLVGPVRRVTCSAKINFPEILIANGPEKGTKIKVNTPTHIAGIMDFVNGSIGTIITSTDVWTHELPYIEIYGTKGTMSVPDPNCFVGSVRIKLANENEWKEVPLTHTYTGNRGIGVADMAYALNSGRDIRASGELAYHVLDIMNSFLDSSKEGKHVILKSTCLQPKPLPIGLKDFTLD